MLTRISELVCQSLGTVVQYQQQTLTNNETRELIDKHQNAIFRAP